MASFHLSAFQCISLENEGPSLVNKIIMLHLMVILSYPSPCSKLSEVFYVRHRSLSLKSQAATAFVSSYHWTVTGPWSPSLPSSNKLRPETRSKSSSLPKPTERSGSGPALRAPWWTLLKHVFSCPELDFCAGPGRGDPVLRFVHPPPCLHGEALEGRVWGSNCPLRGDSW